MLKYTIKDKRINGFIHVVDSKTGAFVKRFKTSTRCAQWLIVNNKGCD